MAQAVGKSALPRGALHLCYDQVWLCHLHDIARGGRVEAARGEGAGAASDQTDVLTDRACPGSECLPLSHGSPVEQVGGRAGMAAMITSLIGDLDFVVGLLERLQSRHHVRLVRGDRGSGGPYQRANRDGNVQHLTHRISPLFRTKHLHRRVQAANCRMSIFRREI
jgi:hypothetical protein